MLRHILVFALSAVLILTIILPGFTDANSRLDELTRRIEELKKQEAAQRAKMREVENQIAQIENQQAQIREDLMAIDLKMNETQEKINELNKEIDKTTKEAEQTAKELEQAEMRVAERDQLLKTRVRAMYEAGDVSYLEVLLGSRSFGDFLQRLRVIKLIVDQDRKILEDNKRDRDLIAQKKQEIEAYLDELQTMFAEAEALKVQYEKQKKERLVVMAELQEKEGELEETLHQYDQMVMKLAEEQEKLIQEKNSIMFDMEFDGVFAWPVPASHRITSEFGYRKDPFTGKTSGHNGMDIGAPTGTTIVAAADGYVVVAGYVRGFGNTVIINHGNNVRTLYGHIRNGGIMVKVGQKVKKGQKIAEVGSTGRSTGPHLHFGVYENGQAVNPRKYLQ
ncbi:MAG: peptidoglycan DD-metalloendopeptidase family protein [Bacillaceae bacterium]|nr:peptidoglycan DD-metalloendopeptidase family protein [Bacillaceae bacterium]